MDRASTSEPLSVNQHISSDDYYNLGSDTSDFVCSKEEIETFNNKYKPVLNYILDGVSGGECPYISVDIYNKKFKGLLDSGANQIFINESTYEFLHQLGIVLHTENVSSCVLANNQELKCLGFVNIPITLENKTHIFKCFVLSDLRHSIVLGTVFWIKMGIVPDLRKGYWSFSKEQSFYSDSLNSLQTSDDLTNCQRKKLNQIVDGYFNRMQNVKLGCVKDIEHEIITSSKPIKSKYYPVSPYMQTKINEEIDKMLDLDVIEPSNSGWSSPILMVPKKDNTYRFCVDFRKLNAVTEKCAYPLPHISSILDSLGNAKYLTSLDIKNAYWQIKLSEKSKQYTAFTIPGRGLFQFKRLAFGLTNAPGTFQKIIDVLLAEFPGYVFRYLDDIIIVTPDFETHLRILESILDKLAQANLVLNKEKCVFCRPELKFLGYIVNRNGLAVDPDKISAIVNMPSPKSPREVKRIIGMIMWYRKFIPDLSTITEPITKLTRKNCKFVWSADCEQAFAKIKDLLVSAPILACPNFEYPFILECDASSYGLGCVLSQVYDGREHVICYLSRSLTRTERNFSATELECLSVLWSIEKLRCYLEGAPNFTVITDHHSLLWLNNLKDPHGRLGRWVLKLQMYNFTILHRPGRFHQVPDCLSRAIPEETFVMSEISLENIKDSWYNKLVSQVKINPLKYSNFRISDGGILYKNMGKTSSDATTWKQVVPKEKRIELLKKFHDDPTSGGHFGIYKTYHRILENYCWPGMQHDITRYVNKCKICAAHKPEQKLKAGIMGKKPEVNRCWQYIAIDLIGPFPRSTKGYQHILVVCDFFSKFTLLYPLRQATASSIIRILEEQVFLLFGVPEILKCDNGTQFKSKEFSKLLNEYHVKVFYNPLYHPEPNFSERSNRVIKTMIASYIEENHKKWDKYLPQLACAYRTAKHEVVNNTPYSINFGCEMIVDGNDYELIRDRESIVDGVKEKQGSKESEKLMKMEKLRLFVKDRLKKAHEKTKHDYNLRHRPQQYSVNDFVWVKSHFLSSSIKDFSAKLGDKFCGPYRVSKKLGVNTYELRDDSGVSKGNWHVSQLKPDKTLDAGQ